MESMSLISDSTKERISRTFAAFLMPLIAFSKWAAYYIILNHISLYEFKWYFCLSFTISSLYIMIYVDWKALEYMTGLRPILEYDSECPACMYWYQVFSSPLFVAYMIIDVELTCRTENPSENTQLNCTQFRWIELAVLVLSVMYLALSMILWKKQIYDETSRKDIIEKTKLLNEKETTDNKMKEKLVLFKNQEEEAQQRLLEASQVEGQAAIQVADDVPQPPKITKIEPKVIVAVFIITNLVISKALMYAEIGCYILFKDFDISRKEGLIWSSLIAGLVFVVGDCILLCLMGALFKTCKRILLFFGFLYVMTYVVSLVAQYYFLIMYIEEGNKDAWDAYMRQILMSIIIGILLSVLCYIFMKKKRDEELKAILEKELEEEEERK